MRIKEITALEIIDSRACPTISVTVRLEDGSFGESSVPSGASTGAYEAVELRDDDKSRYHGSGVLQVIRNIEEIIDPKLINQDVYKQEEIDKIMIDLDGTDNKSKLGANAILAVSMACAKAASVSSSMPLYEYLSQLNPKFSGNYLMPIPMMNLLNGGKHADWSTDIQEYMILPVGAKNFDQAIRMGVEIYQSLKSILQKNNYSICVGDEGGFAPKFKDNEEAFKFLEQAVITSNYKLNKDIVFAIDAAATEFHHGNLYHLTKEGRQLTSNQLIKFYKNLADTYPIISFEDPLAEDDWQGFKDFSQSLKGVQVVGDDLYVTNTKRLERGIKEKSTNSILIKLNQIGTLSETIKAINLAQENNLTTIISHRSGETEDTFIADLSVAMESGQIKTGAPCRSERTSKYNRLLRIASELGPKTTYAKFPFKV
ncbi:MAG: phosphopyruvate hydratase [Clostridia bacterium]|nr:phosphopyruvate hydratase [Clostridia bacterium]